MLSRSAGWQPAVSPAGGRPYPSEHVHGVKMNRFAPGRNYVDRVSARLVNAAMSVYVDAGENRSYFLPHQPWVCRSGHGEGESSRQFSYHSARLQKLAFVFRWRFPHPSTGQLDFPT